MWTAVARGKVTQNDEEKEWAVLNARELTDGSHVLRYGSAEIVILIEGRFLTIDFTASKDPVFEAALTNGIFGDETYIGGILRNTGLMLESVKLSPGESELKGDCAIHFLLSDAPSVVIEWHESGVPPVFSFSDKVVV